MKQLPFTAGFPGMAAERKLIDLAVIKKGARDFLSFFDETKELLLAYLYHRTGSRSGAENLLADVYLDLLNRALSVWWFGSLSFALLIRDADKVLGRTKHLQEADTDNVYVKTLTWLTEDQRQAIATLHETVWTLEEHDQQLFILRYFLGLPIERIALLLGISKAAAQTGVDKARVLLLTRWGQPESILDSLVYMPALDIARETGMRFALVEKYNALRMRRFQWVIAGGLLAVFSNMIVASVLAFAVVTQPPTTLKGTKQDLASLDAIVVTRERERAKTERAVGTLYRESQNIAAFEAGRTLTEVGASAGRQAILKRQERARVLTSLIERAEKLVGWVQMIAVRWVTRL